MKEYLHGFIFITVFIVFGGKVPRAMFLSKAQYNQARCWHRSNNQLGVIQAHPNSPPRTIHTTKEIRTSEIRSRYLLLVRAPHLEVVPVVHNSAHFKTTSMHLFYPFSFRSLLSQFASSRCFFVSNLNEKPHSLWYIHNFFILFDVVVRRIIIIHKISYTINWRESK